MRTGRRFQFGLAPKLVFFLGVTTAAVILIYASVSLRYQRLEAEHAALYNADRLSDLIQRSTRYSMLHNDRAALAEALNTIGGQPGIHRVRVFSATGEISFSTDPHEIGTAVNKDAEACFGCHGDPQRPAEVQRPPHARIITDASGGRNLGVVRVVENEPACATAACHAHPASQRVLGLIDTDLSLASVDSQLAAQRKRVMGIALVTVVVLTITCIAFVWWFVGKPVHRLMEGTKRLAKGNLDYRLEIRSQDELGDLAGSFNEMAESLDRARREITDWGHRLEERVEQKSRELEGAQRSLVVREKMASLGTLAATVAHEVNNPLAGILTYAHLSEKQLKNLDCDPAIRSTMVENLRIIQRESARCGELMRNLLAFARQTPSRREPNDLNLLVKQGLALVRHRLELKNIQLKEDLQADLPQVRCDAGQMRQIILALVVNAIEAMPDGGVLEVSTKVDARGPTAILLVRDTGVGIPDEILARIFDPFFTTKDSHQGAGLGLAVAHGIVEQHGGDIVVHSTPGKGSEFRVSLPLGASVNPNTPVATQGKR
jgi:two-component system, NtrC family, sensor kinase